jgi:sulfoxide reductase heme-binding subunit YedZ
VTSAGPHLFWITSRAAGTAALVLASLSVSAGLLIGGRLLRGPGRAIDLRVAHEALSLATLIAIAVHGLALLGDGFLRPSPIDIAVPFVGRYRPLWTGVGIVAGWALAALGLSYYARGRIGAARWRAAHRFTALAWIAGVLHSLLDGSDAGQLWFLALTAIVVVPALVLLLARSVRPARGPRPGQSVPPARQRQRHARAALRRASG